MAEFEGLYSYNGIEFTLIEQEVSVGDQAPDFTVLAPDFSRVRLSDATGKTLVISATPSLDTPVCALQLRTFNQAVATLGDNVEVWNISVDLPFAISRVCAADGIDGARALSDHYTREFGLRYGVLVKQNALLARSVWVVDGSGRVAYKQIVPSLTQEPDYEAALDAVRALEAD
jgi:thiol peroxidase